MILIKIRDGANAVIRLCEWDALNQLVAIQSAEALAAGVKRSEFSYDGAGRRVRQIEKEHNGSQWVVQSDWRYVWDGLELAQKRDTGTGAVLVNYFGGGEQGGGSAIVYLPDHLGSVRGWYRVSDGTRGEADFSAYGQRTVTTTGPGVPERGFTGHLHHAASGLVLAPFRAYDPELGRWISEDPLGEDGGVNLYGYVGNGPVASFDPWGRFKVNADGSMDFQWGQYVGDLAGAWYGGMAAFVDGVIPFADPLEKLGAYNGCDSAFRFGQGAGSTIRNMWAAYGGAAGASRLISGGASMSVGATTGSGSGFHMFYSVTAKGTTTWMHAALTRSGTQMLTQVSPGLEGFSTYWNTVTGIPIFFPSAAAVSGAAASNCVTGALGAMRRGLLGF